MKIVLLTSTLNIGGAQTQMALLAEGLKSKGHSVHIISYNKGAQLCPQLEKAGIEYTTIRRNSRWETFRFLRKLSNKINELNPDIVYSFLLGPNVLLSILKSSLRAKIVWGIRASDMDFTKYHLSEQITFFLSRILSKRADKIISNSHAGAKYHILYGYPSEKFVVVQNGIELQKYNKNSTARARGRRELDISEDQILIGTVARIDPMKGHDTLIAAAKNLCHTYQNLKFVCVGGGNQLLKERLINTVAELEIDKHFIFLDETTELNSLYNAFDLFVLPSSYGEGFSNVLVEAVASGLPVIATDCGDAAQILKNPNAIVQRKNPEALSIAIAKWITRGEEFVATDSEHAKQFSIERMVSLSLQELESVLR